MKGNDKLTKCWYRFRYGDLEDMSFLLLICKAKKGVKRIQRGVLANHPLILKLDFFLVMYCVYV
jgi:hypothetical protein